MSSRPRLHHVAQSYTTQAQPYTTQAQQQGEGVTDESLTTAHKLGHRFRYHLRA